MITLTLNANTQRRLADIARRRGTSEGDLARRYRRHRHGHHNRLESPLPPFNVATARAALGLDQGDSFS